jgi:N-acetylmuramoyl-L-alanine amidase
MSVYLDQIKWSSLFAFIICSVPLLGTSKTTDFIVALDPGHGGINFGAPNPNREGHYEKEYTLQIAKNVRTYLKMAGLKVWMTRTKDKGLGLQKRVQKASLKGADLFVSIHINDAYVIGPRGHGTFFLTREAFEESRGRMQHFHRKHGKKILNHHLKNIPKNKKIQQLLLNLIHQQAQHESSYLAHMVNQGLSEWSPFGTRGVKQGNYGILKGISLPAIVCEVGFINHPREGPYVTSTKGMQEIAKGIALGIMRYVNLRKGIELHIPQL